MANARFQKATNVINFDRGGNSLTIYEEVLTLMDYLDGVEEIPETCDLFQECDNLASRLRRI